MNCSGFDMLLGLTLHELSADERRSIATHLETCIACRARHNNLQAIDRLLAASTAGIPVRGAGHAASMLRAPRTRLLVRLAWWGAGMYRMGRGAAPPAIGIALLVLGVWLVSNIRPKIGSNANSLSSLEQRSQLNEGTAARVWLLRATPKPETVLQGDVPFDINVGYQLYAAESAMLSVRVVDVPSGQTRYFSPPQLVLATEQRAVVSFVLDVDRARALFGSGPVQLEAVLRDAAPGAGHAVLAAEKFAASRYMIK